MSSGLSYLIKVATCTPEIGNVMTFTVHMHRLWSKWY